MSKYLILVNKNHKFKDNNFHLVETNSAYAKVYLEERTYQQFLKLKDYIKKKGYDIDIESGYRSYIEQELVFNETKMQKGLEHTLKYVAKPGYSEHQTGLALDFFLKENNKFYVDFEMTNHSVLEIVASSSFQFGFIIRYPKGKEKVTGYGYEPWHLRYVGKKAALDIYKNNLTLEEYLERIEYNARNS